MEEYGNWFELQMKNRIRIYNRQRAGMTIFIGISMAILLMLPAVAIGEIFTVCFSILCTAIFMICSLSFVLSGRASKGLFIVTIIIVASQFILTQKDLELLLILMVVNIGTFFAARLTSLRFIQSVTQEIETVHALKVKANTDNLTRLLNRNGLEQAINTAWALYQRDQKSIGVLLVDIDFFKRFNDILGHVEGDKILKQVADKMRECFKRKTDIISRIGGEEFVILLPDIRDDDVVEMARDLLSAVTSLGIKVTTGLTCSFLTVSIGIAMGIPQSNDSFIDFYKCADEALYHAKGNGRNCISYNQKIIKNFFDYPQSNPMDSVQAPGQHFGTGDGLSDSVSC
ncbi:GGDEF domain-containing protein [Caproicibacter sp. BJN0012]|uniref:GGDEF domain-containing protein n=1 Tax=Caproicibacter sp. BJN0012 TaxID=3110227 RepID=UPI002E1390C2